MVGTCWPSLPMKPPAISHSRTNEKIFEVRRGELRLRAEYQRQPKGLVRLSVQAG